MPPSTTSSSTRFDHQLYDLLERNNGVFIGERHDHASVRQALTHLMPALRARGVGTLSVELPQDRIDAMLRAESTDAYVQSLPESGFAFTGGEDAARSVSDLVRAAHRAGIRVLGHDDEPDVGELEQQARNNLRDRSPALGRLVDQAILLIQENPDMTFEGLPEDLRNSIRREVDAITSDSSRQDELLAFREYVAVEQGTYALTEAGMNDRNRQAAEYIRTHSRGRVLVLGGAYHSGNHSPDDAETARARQEGIPRAMRVTNQYCGLDQLLEYPSVDYNVTDPRGPVGQTVRTDGRFNDHEVTLPPDLRDLRITSWPPPGGVPTVESVRSSAAAPAGPAAPIPTDPADPPTSAEPVPLGPTGGPTSAEPVPAGGPTPVNGIPSNAVPATSSEPAPAGPAAPIPTVTVPAGPPTSAEPVPAGGPTPVNGIPSNAAPATSSEPAPTGPVGSLNVEGVPTSPSIPIGPAEAVPMDAGPLTPMRTPSLGRLASRTDSLPR